MRPQKRRFILPVIARCCWLLLKTISVLPVVAGYCQLLPVVAEAYFARPSAIAGNEK